MRRSSFSPGLLAIFLATSPARAQTPPAEQAAPNADAAPTLQGQYAPPAEPPVAPPAAAAARPSKYYAALDFGVFFPMGNGLLGAKPGPGFELDAGMSFSPNIAAEIAFGTSWTRASDLMFAPGGITDPDDIELSFKTITAGARASLPLGGVSLFARAGLGMNMAKMVVNYTTHTSTSTTSTGQSFADEALAYYVGAGAAFSLGSRLALGLEARLSSGEGSFDGFTLDLTTIRGAASLAYRF